MQNLEIVSANEFLKVNNRHGEYLIKDKNSIVADGLTYEQAVMEKKMLDGEEIDFEEYEKTMSEF